MGAGAGLQLCSCCWVVIDAMQTPQAGMDAQLGPAVCHSCCWVLPRHGPPLGPLCRYRRSRQAMLVYKARFRRIIPAPCLQGEGEGEEEAAEEGEEEEEQAT